MTKTTQIRQGDVMLARVARQPKTFTPVALDAGRVILAYGEVTGHAHQVVAETETGIDTPPSMLVDAPDGQRYLLVDRPCSLVHEEHDPHPLTPGCYRVVRQREYAPDAIRNVQD